MNINEKRIKMIKVKLIISNNIKISIDWKKLFVKSKLFYLEKVKDSISLSECLVENRNSYISYLDEKKITTIFQSPKENQINILIADTPFKDNFYVKRVNTNDAVISIAQIKLILDGHVPIENFILKCIYELVSIYQLFKSLLPNEIPKMIHNETRGCLYDMNGDLNDAVASTRVSLDYVINVKLNFQIIVYQKNI